MLQNRRMAVAVLLDALRRLPLPDCLGIDVGGEMLALAVVSRTRSGPVVKSFERIPYGQPGLDLAARAAFAARAVAEGPYARLPLAVSLSGTDVFLRPLTVPFTKASHIAKTLKFEMDGQLPFDVESAVMDFVVSLPAEKSTRIIVAALPRETLQRVTEPFEAASLALKMITADVLCAPALAAYFPDDDFTTLDVGPDGWKMSVCRQGRLLFARAAAPAPGGDKMESAIAGWFKQSLMAAPSEAASAKVYLFGRIARALDVRAFSAALGAEVELVRFPDASLDAALAGRADDLCEGGANAVAAASALCLRRADFDLYAAAHGRRSPFERVFAPALSGLVVLALLMALFAFDAGKSLLNEKARARQAQSDELEVWTALFASEKPPGGSVHLGLLSKLKEVQEGAANETMGGEAAPILKALYAVSQAKNSAAGIRFERFEAKKGSASLQASGASDQAAENLAAEITAHSAFDAKAQDFRTEDQRVVFKIVMTPKGVGNVR